MYLHYNVKKSKNYILKTYIVKHFNLKKNYGRKKLQGRKIRVCVIC